MAFASEHDSMLSTWGMATWGAYRTFNESVSVVAGKRSAVILSRVGVSRIISEVVK